MAIQLSYHEECDQGFKPMYGTALEIWLGTPGNATIQGPEWPVEFDQALVLFAFSPPLFYFFCLHTRNGLHPTISRDDPDPTPHVTIRLK
jgi:hypothetical protein